MITTPPPTTTEPVESWYLSKDGGSFFSEAYASQDEAVKAGLEEYQGRHFYVGQSSPPVAPEDCFSVADWIDHVSCQDDYRHDAAEDWDQSTQEQRDELERDVRAVMAKWLDKYDLRPSFFVICEPVRVTGLQKLPPLRRP